MPIVVDLNILLARKKMGVSELADRVGITPANISILKNGRAKAIRFSTLERCAGSLTALQLTSCVTNLTNNSRYQPDE